MQLESEEGDELNRLRASALRSLASEVSNSNGRGYLLQSAWELEHTPEPRPQPTLSDELLASIPLALIFEVMQTRVIPERAGANHAVFDSNSAMITTSMSTPSPCAIVSPRSSKVARCRGNRSRRRRSERRRTPGEVWRWALSNLLQLLFAARSLWTAHPRRLFASWMHSSAASNAPYRASMKYSIMYPMGRCGRTLLRRMTWGGPPCTNARISSQLSRSA